ncbi:MAG: hypothetical protein U0736_20700 [Gemmataceae bacterium]
MELPVCRWRGEAVPASGYACHSPKLVVGPAGVTAELCGGCYCRDHPPVPARHAPPPCRHLGGVVGTQTCPTCTGRVRLKVFACGLHGQCLPGRPAVGLPGCAGCLDYAPPAETPTDPDPDPDR